jgi:3' terminal RNA ribose 2'-O-methyltransferase Hen1
VLLTITTTHQPADELGYLLHKNPARTQSFEISVGTAHVFYPEVTAQRCSAALLLEVDPIGLIRGRKSPASEAFTLGQYVNDRPYAASSMLSVAIKDVFRTALTGRCNARPELAATPIPLELRVPAVPCRGGADLARRLFEPLGWTVLTQSVPLDPELPAWGDSRYVDLRLSGTLRLSAALNHLYVMLPVLDDAKHYWVSTDEIDKLIRAGGDWLAGHPEKNLITRRYLAHKRELTRTALDRLAEVDDAEPEELENVEEQPSLPLAVQRRGAVLAALKSASARTVADLGCGEGALLGELAADRQFTKIVGADVSARSLSIAARRIQRKIEHQPGRVELIQSSLVYRDDRLAGFDAAVLMEVIEHVDPPRLDALERSIFGHAAPGTVVVTTPNVEHNVRYETLPSSTFRHRDHRFEWTREQFREWADGTAGRNGYHVRYVPVGTDDPEVGPPTQMAIFTKGGGDD